MNLKDDSRKIKKGDTFIAIDNGRNYIEDAIKKGAKKIITEDKIYSVDTVIVNDTREYLANIIEKKFKKKLNKITLIGITGTNGKTTTSYLIYQLFNLFNIKCAYIGTIGFYYGNVKRELNNTTPDVDLLYEMLIEAYENKCQYVVMEVSSHALSLNRIYGLKYDAVAFTNLTRDHLDFHKTMDEYKKAKMKLFKLTRNEKIAVINGDDDNSVGFTVTISPSVSPFLTLTFF